MYRVHGINTYGKLNIFTEYYQFIYAINKMSTYSE